MPAESPYLKIPIMANLTSLYLAPIDPLARPEPTAIKKLLEKLGVLDGPLGTNRFTAGEGFTRHVIYAGCSPYLVTEPPADGSLQFCHVALHGPYPEPRLVTGPNTVAPRCPACRARFKDWRGRLATWQQAPENIHCEQCGKQTAAYTLDWREHAIGGRYLIELRNVYPGEASPSDRLMAQLSQTSGFDWRHAWAAYLTA